MAVCWPSARTSNWFLSSENPADKNLGTDGTYPKFQFAKARERPVRPALSRGSADKKTKGGAPGDCCDAIHPCVAGFAVKMPVKLSRY